MNFCPETCTKPVEAGGGATVVVPVPEVVLGLVVAGGVVVGGGVVAGGVGALVPGMHWE